MMRANPLAHALDGVRVLDTSRLLPGPYLSMMMADMGADVVKIEAPGQGDYLRYMPRLQGGISGRFQVLNRNKRSLVLNLKAESGRDAFLRMAEQADVVIESFRPGVMERLGLSYDTLSARNLRLIMCAISGYGQDGPYRDRAGHDLNYVGLAGILAMGGTTAGAPALPGVQMGDLAGGALWGIAGILSALFARERSGRGTYLDISMTEGALALLAAEFGNMDASDAGDAMPTRGTMALNGGLACYRIYRTADDKYLSVAALEPKFWIALNRALGRSGDESQWARELLAPAARQDEIAAELASIFRTKSRDTWAKELAPHDCCCEPVLELCDVEQHPQHRARGVFGPSPSSSGASSNEEVRRVRTPLGDGGSARPAPSLGRDSREVLSDYGFSRAEIDGLLGQQNGD